MDKVDYLNVKTCSRCGRLYETFLEMNYCQTCYKKLEEKLEEVRIYVKANEYASIEEVAVALKVDSKQLIGWVRESRLMFTAPSGVTVPCLKCQLPIAHGKYCAVCRSEIMNDLQSVYEKPEMKKTGRLTQVKGTKMHFLNRRDKRGK